MYLYYTTITGNESEQIVPALSLGGYKSSSRLQNSRFNNLFADISNLTIVNFNQNQYVGLVLKNELGAIKTNVKLWFDYPAKCYSKFRVAAVDMSLDSSNALQMEHIDNINSQPLSGDFFEADGADNKVSLGDMAINEQIGIWIERSLLLDFIKSDQSAIYEDDTDKPGRVKEIPLTKEDDIKINISWD